MRSSRLTTFLLLAGFLICGSRTSAQLFGDRNIKRNRKARTMDSTTIVNGAERFVRGNRTTNDFVGAGADITATSVGATQTGSTVPVQGSVTGLTEETSPAVNIPRTRTATGIYAERLAIAFKPSTKKRFRLRLRSRSTLSKPLSRIAQHRGFEVKLSPADSTVLIRGTVRSERQKRIAELLVLFEPGIGTVTNELRVEPTSSR